MSVVYEKRKEFPEKNTGKTELNKRNVLCLEQRHSVKVASEFFITKRFSNSMVCLIVRFGKY